MSPENSLDQRRAATSLTVLLMIPPTHCDPLLKPDLDVIFL